MTDAFAAAVAVAGGPDHGALASAAPDALVPMLERHRLVARSERFADHLGPDALSVLRPRWRAGAARSLGHHAALADVTRVLAASGLRAVGFKGVVLQERLTGRIVGRDQVDLDVLVPEGTLGVAVRALLSEGWRLSAGLTLELLREPLPSELPLHHPERAVHLDLHQALFAHRYALDDAERALGRRVVGGRHDPLGTALLVGLSGGKDVWSTLRHVSDLADVAGLVDLGALQALADRTHTRRVLDVGFGLVEHVLARPTGWTPVAPVGALVTRIARALTGPRLDRPTPERMWCWLASRERWVDRVRFVARIPTSPAVLDLRDPGRGPRPLRRTVRLLRSYARARGPVR